jgi:hypothetical protein
MKPEFELVDRRGFFGAAARTGLVLGLAPMAAGSAAAEATNPFAYDLSKFEKTDPKLVTHEVAGRWTCVRKNARSVAAGPDDQIFVAAGNYVSAFAGDGHPGLDIALPDRVYCAAVAADGTIFAGTRSAVHVFDPRGREIAAWNSPEPKSWFTGIAPGAQDVFVADSGKRVILRFSREGKPLGRAGEKNSARGAPGLAVPSPYLSVLIHRDGLLRINNTGRHQVEAYSFDGEFAGAWGKPGFAIGGFCGCCNPVAIAALPDGRVVTAEKGLPRVKIYSAAGEFESVVAGTELFPENARACSSLNDCAHGGLAVAANSRGRIYILDYVTNDVRVMQRKA